jgi:alpha-tubulin suppressor-like RCC1 family protein
MPVTYRYPYIQYGGVWTTSQATDAVASGTWAVPPAPHLLSWGFGNNGRLGLGNTTNYSSPKQVGNLTDWSIVSTAGGGLFSTAIKTDGTLWTWGTNSNGQLGLGNKTNYSSPKQVGALTNWLKVSAGYSWVAAIKTDGTLWTWGLNSLGQLGLNNLTYYSSPKQVGALTNWSSVSCGYYISGAVKTNGTLWTWGYNGYGTLGYGNSTYYSSPKQVGALTNWLSVTAGYLSIFAIKTDGTLWAWGLNSSGELGLGNTTIYNSPKQVGALTNWAIINSNANNGAFNLSIKTDGTLWSWGSNDHGNLGIGVVSAPKSSPIQVGTLTNWYKISAGARASYGIATDGTAWSWGKNSDYGQLGLGNQTSYSSPKQIGSLTTWIQITGGYNFALAIART